MSFSKDDYARRSRAYLTAFQAVAKKLGKDDPMTQLMGGLAWGRHDAECGPDQDTLRARAVEYGFLYGCERMLVKWCNDNNRSDARKLLLDTVRKVQDQWGV
jgi:hypothetical protein